MGVASSEGTIVGSDRADSGVRRSNSESRGSVDDIFARTCGDRRRARKFKERALAGARLANRPETAAHGVPYADDEASQRQPDRDVVRPSPMLGRAFERFV